MTGLVSRLAGERRELGHALWGVAGQAFALAGTVVPVAAGTPGDVAFVVTVSGISTSCVPLFSLAASHRLPVILDEHDLFRATMVSLWMSILGAALVGVGGSVIAASLGMSTQALVCISAIAATQSMFVIAVALLANRGGARRMLRARFLYGAATFVSSIAVATVGGDGVAYSLAIAFSYLFATVCIGVMIYTSDRRLVRHRLWPGWREVRMEFSGAISLSMSVTIGTIGGQVGALVTPLLGPFAGAWAIAMRVMSGFQTLGAQTLGAFIDAEVASSLRQRDAERLRRAGRNAIRVGLASGAAFLVVAAGTLALTAGSELSNVAGVAAFSFLFAMTGFAATSVALAPPARLLGLVGPRRVRIGWDLGRFVLASIVLLLTSGSQTMTVLGVGGIIVYLSYAYFAVSFVNKVSRAMEVETSMNDTEELTFTKRWLTRIRGVVRRSRQLLTDSSRNAGVWARRDARVLTDLLAPVPAGSRAHLLLASSGNRNTGDQAMLEAFLQGVDGPVTVVVQPGATYRFPTRSDGLRVVTISSLLMGRRASHKAALREFAALVNEHSTFSVVGADVIDGGYHRRAAASSWALAGAVASSGRDTRILGFSWKPGVCEAVVVAARRATALGVVAYLRDPHSLERFAADGITGGVDSADMVFTLFRPDADESGSTECAKVLVNVSGLIHSRVDLTADYRRLVEGLVRSGYEVVLVPHVENPSARDSIAIGSVVNALETDVLSRVTVIESLRPPSEIAMMCGEASFVITGRMHLAILALSVYTPALVLSTQGKVSGLMERVGTPSWVFEPSAGVGELILSSVRNLKDERNELVLRLKDDVERQRERASLNFEGLGA